MKNFFVSLLLVTCFTSYSQVIEVSYQEEIQFAYVESESLIKQWKNDDVIWADYSYGYDINKGSIIYTFDFYNMKVNRMEYINGEYVFVNEWNIKYIISEWDPKTQHMSCVAETQLGDYFYEINSFDTGERCLLMSYKNVYNIKPLDLPSFDWDKYNVGVVSTNYGNFNISLIR